MKVWKLDGTLSPKTSLRLKVTHNGLLPLVTLALSGPEEAFQWLLSQLLRYSFCGICGNELEGLDLITRGEKLLFPRVAWMLCSHFLESLKPLYEFSVVALRNAP